MQQPTKGKKSTVLIVSAIVAFSLALVLYYSFKEPVADQGMIELVARYNNNCPLTIQEGIRLDNVTLPKDKVVQYNLTLLNIEKATAEVEVIKHNIQESLLSTVKANPGLKAFRDNNFTLIYNYDDKKAEYLFEITITPEQYK
jgi:flagellar basal body-associated protein FliL